MEDLGYSVENDCRGQEIWARGLLQSFRQELSVAPTRVAAVKYKHPIHSNVSEINAMVTGEAKDCRGRRK